MKLIDDLVFSKFVNNALSQSDMIEVEKSLMQEKEAQASIYASILNYEVNIDTANNMLGIDEMNLEQKNEEFIQETVGTGNCNDSIVIENEVQTFNNSMNMKMNLAQEEAQKVQELFTAYKEFENSELTIDENLINFYLAQRAGAFPEDVTEIVSSLHKGIETFNVNLTNALKEENIDYLSQLKELGQELNNEQKYELYINFLAAVQVLDAQNFDAESVSQIENFDSIKQKFAVLDEVSDEMLTEVEEKIVETLNNNTLCMASMDCLPNIMNVVPDGSVEINKVLRGSEEDMRNKLISSLVTYIVYQNGEISSLEGQEVPPEIMAVAVASGIEEAQIVEDVRVGKTSVDSAIKILKTIGGVILWTTLTLGIAYIAAHIAAFSFGFLVGLLGVSTVALVVSGSIALVLWYALFMGSEKPINQILKWTGSAYDVVTSRWRESVWPTIKEKVESFISWVRNLLSNKNVETTQETLPVVVTVS